MQKQILTSILFVLCFWRSDAQVLDFLNKVSFELKDGTTVVLYGSFRSMDTLFSNEYYYLPTSLRLSRKPDKTPEFLFMKYTTEERTDAGGVEGALMHFLMTWGLTQEQEKEAETLLATKLSSLASSNPRYKLVKNPKIMGAANMKTAGDNSFQIISAILSNQKMTPTLVTSGQAPLIPGGKVAVAALLEKNAAQLMASTFEKSRSISDVSVALKFKYDVMMPAVEGRITVNWMRVDSVYQRYKRDAVNYDGGDKGSEDNYVSDSETDSLFSLMRETKAVDVKIENLLPESQAAQDMVNAFMEYFLKSISEREFRKPEGNESPSANRDKDKYNHGYNEYHVDRAKLEQKISRRNETYNLKVRLPITQDFVLTENMGSWYDAAKDNKNCVNTVNLNDPFFEHRDIQLILDLDAEDMFGKELNFVTVDIRKRRSETGANDFSKQVTFDNKYFKENKSNRSVVSYSKAQDADPDVFEYRTLWSLRGGNVYSPDTNWVKGRWEGVSLAPPVATIPIKFEAELADLKALDIRNVSLQLRYYKFGKEVETTFNINTASGIGYIEKNIYMDRNTQGYAYRLVFTHKTKGNLATDWDAKVNTGYMFAVIPEGLRNNEQQTIDKMFDIAKDMIAVPEGKEVNKGSVLDKFKDLIKSN